VPSRTRFQRQDVVEVGALLVGDQLAIDGVGDPALEALEAPHGFHRLLCRGWTVIEIDTGQARPYNCYIDKARFIPQSWIRRRPG